MVYVTWNLLAREEVLLEKNWRRKVQELSTCYQPLEVTQICCQLSLLNYQKEMKFQVHPDFSLLSLFCLCKLFKKTCLHLERDIQTVPVHNFSY